MLTRSATILTLAIVLSVVACHHHHKDPPFARPKPIVCPGIATTGPSALDAAPAVIAKALNGAHPSEEDFMLRVEAKLPGFGGWFLASDTFKVFLKQPSSVSQEDVRKIFYDTYSPRTEDYVRRLVALGPQVKVIQGQYSLSELIAIENLVVSGGIPKWTGAGTRLWHNRLVVGFADSASVCPGAALMASKGIPLDAVELEVMGMAWAR